jgi:Xaa-Pro dipeptidase
MDKKRMEQLIEHINLAKLDALLICPSEEMNYLIGFSPMMCGRFQGMFVRSDGRMFYICNLLYGGEIEHEIKGIDVFTWFDGDVMADEVFKILKNENLNGKKIGVNSTAPAFNILDIAEKTGIEFVNARPLFEEMRIIKSEDEIENLRISSSITDKVYEGLIKLTKPGVKEATLKEFLLSEMARLGGTRAWALVASGANSSFPHYMGSERVIEEQDVILLDFGCAYNNMCSDMSRMVFVGEVTDEQRAVYEVCRKATEAGQAACFEGAFIPDIDNAARKVIEDAGYGEFFVNRLGHGIGYMGDEAPDIKQGNPRKLEKGMAFTIEPGINLPDKFGMRVENVIVITEKGAEILNKTTHDLVIV